MKKLLLTAALGLAIAGNALAEPVTYKLDPTHTDVIASWTHMGFSHPAAHFGNVDGQLVYDADNVDQSSVEVTLPLTGLSSHVADFDEHLRSSDFFDAEKYPEITFKSTRVEAAGDDKLRVWGDLTLHGVTRQTLMDVTINQVGKHPMSGLQAAGFDATTQIKRSDFGLDKYVPNVSDEVRIRITTEASVPKSDDVDSKAKPKE